MSKFLVVGGAVYRQALRAPKSVFDEAQPQLATMHDKALAVKRHLWKSYYSDPKIFLDALNKALAYIEKIPTIQNAEQLDKWTGWFGTVGLKMVDQAEVMKKGVKGVERLRAHFKNLRDQAEAQAQQSKDPGYAKIVEVVDGFFEDMATPAT